jgi:hypothetical protein
MRTVKASYIWGHEDFKYLLIPRILQSFFNIKLVWTTPQNCDLLLVGPYKKYKLIKKKFLSSNNIFFNNVISSLEKGLFFRKYKPLSIFYSRENERIFDKKENFKIGTDYNYFDDESYLRIPIWKDFIDWSHLELSACPITFLNARRFGSHYNLLDLTNPQGIDFIKKPKNLCCFFSYLTEPRKSLISRIRRNFVIDGYGKAFNEKIKNHNESNFLKKDVLKNYFGNFCPENSLYPGWYTEKVPDAFISKSLPITWADQNISNDFNIKSFINLNDYNLDQIKDLFDELKNENFLLKFSKEPLLLTEPNLDQEIAFVKRIVNNFL